MHVPEFHLLDIHFSSEPLKLVFVEVDRPVNLCGYETDVYAAEMRIIFPCAF